jgi:hypothetical protein
LQAVGFDLGHFVGAFGGAGLGEESYREYAFGYTPALEKELYRVLFQEEVENGHLTDLSNVGFCRFDTGLREWCGGVI